MSEDGPNVEVSGAGTESAGLQGGLRKVKKNLLIEELGLLLLELRLSNNPPLF